MSRLILFVRLFNVNVMTINIYSQKGQVTLRAAITENL